MSRPERHQPQRSPLQLPSPNVVQLLALFVELRDLAQQLVELHRKQIELLQTQPPGSRADELDCITVAEAAEKLRFDPRTIHRMIAEGELQAVGSGPRLRVLRASLRAYIERHRDQ